MISNLSARVVREIAISVCVLGPLRRDHAERLRVSSSPPCWKIPQKSKSVWIFFQEHLYLFCLNHWNSSGPAVRELLISRHSPFFSLVFATYSLSRHILSLSPHSHFVASFSLYRLILSLSPHSLFVTHYHLSFAPLLN